MENDSRQIVELPGGSAKDALTEVLREGARKLLKAAVEAEVEDDRQCIAEHWNHIRTTNPIESTFATVRLRTRRTKGSGSRVACFAMVFKLVMLASESWRLLNG